VVSDRGRAGRRGKDLAATIREGLQSGRRDGDLRQSRTDRYTAYRADI